MKLALAKLLNGLPFKLGTKWLKGKYGKGLQIKYTGYPTRIHLDKADIVGKELSEIEQTLATKFINALDKNIKELPNNKGNIYKKPILWGHVDVPLNQTRLGETLSQQALLSENILNAIEHGDLAKKIPDSGLDIVLSKKLLPGKGSTSITINPFLKHPVIHLEDVNPRSFYHEVAHIPQVSTQPRAAGMMGLAALESLIEAGVPLGMIYGQDLAAKTENKWDDKIAKFLHDYGPEMWLAARTAGVLAPEWFARKGGVETLGKIKNDKPVTRSVLKVRGVKSEKDFADFIKKEQNAANWAFGTYLLGTGVPYIATKAIQSYSDDLNKEGRVIVEEFNKEGRVIVEEFNRQKKRWGDWLASVGNSLREVKNSYHENPELFVENLKPTKAKLLEYVKKHPFSHLATHGLAASGVGLVGAAIYENHLDEIKKEKEREEIKVLLSHLPALLNTYSFYKAPVRQSLLYTLQQPLKEQIKSDLGAFLDA